MESLHLTYDEVWRKIPYRNLLIMQKDKLHVVYGGKVLKEVSDEEFFADKGGIKFSE